MKKQRNECCKHSHCTERAGESGYCDGHVRYARHTAVVERSARTIADLRGSKEVTEEDRAQARAIFKEEAE